MSKSKESKDKTTSSKRAKPARLGDLLTPNYLVFCEYVLFGQDQGVSLVKLIDQVGTANLPVTPPRLSLVAEFARCAAVSASDFRVLKPVLMVQLRNPAGKRIDLGEYPVSEMSADKMWNIHRLILDLSMGISFGSEGRYMFEVYGRTEKTEFELVSQKVLPIYLQKKKKL